MGAFVEPDSGRAVVVLVASTLIHGSLMGFVYSGGIFLVEFVSYFQTTVAVASWLPSLQLALLQIAALIGGVFVELVGFHNTCFVGTLIASVGVSCCFFVKYLYQLYFLYDAVVGLGGGLSIISSFVVLQFCFQRYLALSYSISMAGMNFGAMITAPIIQWTMEKYTWRGAMLISGGIIAQGLYLSLLLDVKKPEHSSKSEELHNCSESINMGNEKDHLLSKTTALKQKNKNPLAKLTSSFDSFFKKLLDFSILKTKSLVVLLVSTYFLEFIIVIPYTFIPDRAVDMGIPQMSTASLIMMLSAAQAFSSFVVGFIGDYFPQYPLVIMAASAGLGAAVNIASIFCFNYDTMAVYSILSGIASGLIIGISGVAVRRTVLPHETPKALSLYFFSIGITKLYAAPLAGFLYDTTKTYTPTMLLTGGTGFIASTMLLLSHAWARKMTSIDDR